METNKEDTIHAAIYDDSVLSFFDKFTVKKVSPKYLFLFYDHPHSYAEIAYVDKKGNISQYRPASILLLRNIVNEINEFTGEYTNINFSGIVPKNVVYVNSSISKTIVFYSMYNNIKLSFTNKKVLFPKLNIMYIVHNDKVIAYRFTRYSGENTILYPLNLPNVFKDYICTGNCIYKATNYKNWEEVMKETENFFLKTKFSSDYTKKIKEYYSTFVPDKKTEKWTLKEIMQDYIS